jgi:hypothetical protein
VATVVNGTNGSKNLRINGNIFSPLNRLSAEAGTTLKLQVKSLSPFIELGLINTAKATQQAETKPGIILSQRVLEWSGQNTQANSSNLLRFINLLNTLPAQSLPPATAALIAALNKRLVDPQLLTSPSTLKPTLLDASVLLAGGLTAGVASESSNELKSLLFQLVRSLAGVNSTVQQGMLENDGLALYQNIGRAGAGTAMLLARELGEELLRMFNAQRHDIETDEQYERRWLFELPVNFQDRLRSIVIRIREEESDSDPNTAEFIWKAEFEFELPGCGDLRVELIIENLAVSATITCTKISTARLLEKKHDSLAEKLESNGLQLSNFQSITTNKSAFYAHNSAENKLLAKIENIPLSKFEMRKNESEFNPINGIPEFLYCAMASCFSYIFEIENSLD